MQKAAPGRGLLPACLRRGYFPDRRWSDRRLPAFLEIDLAQAGGHAARLAGAHRRADISVGASHTRIEALLPPEMEVSVGQTYGLDFKRHAAFADDRDPPKLGLAREKQAA